MISKKVSFRYLKNNMPKIGLIALSTDQIIEKDFLTILKNKNINLFINRIPGLNPLTKKNLIKMSKKITEVSHNILPNQKIDLKNILPTQRLSLNPNKGGGRNPPETLSMAYRFVCNEVKSVKPSCNFHFWCLKQVKNINLGGCTGGPRNSRYVGGIEKPRISRNGCKTGF